MKTLKVFILAFVIGTSVYANNTPIETSSEKLRNEISHLLENPRIKINNNEIKAVIEFTLNKKGEIIVLFVDTTNSTVESFVKSKLNYQKVTDKTSDNGKVYKMKLKILNPTH